MIVLIDNNSIPRDYIYMSLITKIDYDSIIRILI
jgi:hypothetical protein